MRERGFSVIEVMVAAGVLALVAALVMPSIAGRLNRRPLERVGADLIAAAALARAEAGVEGVPVAVRLRLDAGRGVWIAESAQIRGEDQLENLGGSIANDESQDLSRATGLADSGPTWRPLRELPTDVSASRAQPETGTPGSAPTAPATPPTGMSDGADEIEELLVAVFLPGGRCIAPGPLYLAHAEADASGGGGVVITFSAWTGLGSLETWTAPSGLEAAPAPPPDDNGLGSWLSRGTDEGDAP